MGTQINIHLCNGFDKSLAPIKAERYRNWWDDNQATHDHARHCLPLAMANSLGYYILSPGTFLVEWDGDYQKRAKIEHIDRSSHYEVDNHAAFGSFVVQPKFIPVTNDPGDFVFIKGIPNERGKPYQCMEAVIEAWWSLANFGLVFMLTQPGSFIIQKGTPIAQMFLYHGAAGAAGIQLTDGYPPGHISWLQKRSRPDYVKDLDYMKGLTYTGDKVQTHLTNWKDANKYNGK